MKRISEETKELILSLREKGMAVRGIMEHLKQQGHTASYGGVYGILKGIKKGGAKASREAGESSNKAEEDSRSIVKEIKDLIEELQTVYMETLKAIRVDLIRARSRIQERKDE